MITDRQIRELLPAIERHLGRRTGVMFGHKFANPEEVIVHLHRELKRMIDSMKIENPAVKSFEFEHRCWTILAAAAFAIITSEDDWIWE